MGAPVRAETTVCRAPRAWMAALVLAGCAFAPLGAAQDATALLSRAATAARLLNYTGTLVYQHAGRVETTRLVHLNEGGKEFEKLVNLEGPPREVIRSNGEVRCYYPDAKVVRIEPRTFRNAFPSLSAQQQKALTEYYELRKAEADRVAGLDVQAWVFEPKDGLRYGQKLWFERVTGLLLKERILNERNEPVEVFTFTDMSIGGKIDHEMVKASWPPAPPAWQVHDAGPAESDAADTGSTRCLPFDESATGKVWSACSPFTPPESRKLKSSAKAERAKLANMIANKDFTAIDVFGTPGTKMAQLGVVLIDGLIRSLEHKLRENPR